MKHRNRFMLQMDSWKLHFTQDPILKLSDMMDLSCYTLSKQVRIYLFRFNFIFGYIRKSYILDDKNDHRQVVPKSGVKTCILLI